MKITAILCTYNRSESLAKALDSLAASVVNPSTEWEVLVVDNNSSDRTHETVEEFIRRYPDRFRYVFEGQPGKSHALNTGIRESQGEVLAFVDDDVTVDSNWLQNLTSRLSEPEWSGVGGPVFPERGVTLPEWIRLEDGYTAGPLVILDLGQKMLPLKEAPFGTNMAFPKKIFEKYGGFRTDLGPQPGSEIRGEDSEFAERVLAAGETLCYEPSAVVYHSVAPSRLRKKYFLAWWFDKGRSDTRMLTDTSGAGYSVAGVPVVFFRRLFMWMLKWTFTVGPGRIRPKLRVWYVAGQIKEFYRRRGRLEMPSTHIEMYADGQRACGPGLGANAVGIGRSHEN